MISRIDHVSIAVRDYESARKFFENVIGAVSGASAEDSNLEYFWHIFSVGDMSRLELITPTGEESFLKNFLNERAGGVHHITMETPDIHEARRRLEESGVPYFGFSEIPELWSELFIHPKNAFGALIQIMQLGPEYHTVEPVKKAQGKRWRVEGEKDGIELSMHHPGGVELKVSLDRDEVKALMKDLESALQDGN